jgi:hypothetical protein
MFPAIHYLCEEGSDDNGELPNTIAASVPPLLHVVSRKRPRDQEESSNTSDAHLPSNENEAGNTSATGSADFVVDLEFADEVEVSVSAHRRKRRDVVENEQSGKSKEGVEATENGVGNEYAQVAAHRESHQIVIAAAAALHLMNSNSEQISRGDGYTNTHSQKVSTSKPPSNELGRQSKASLWEVRLSELTDYCKIHGHCNVPRGYSENTMLACWVSTQRQQYKLQLDGKTSPMTNFRIQTLEDIGFEWNCSGVTWEDRFSELADYRKIQGHCNFPTHYSENIKLARWVNNQKCQYRLHLEGKKSHITVLRIQELESLGFEWGCSSATWEVRFSELADYRKIQGHCNVPTHYSENIKLARWVDNQKCQYRLHLEGKKSHITVLRIQELESLGFEWGCSSAPWEVRLSELADYRKIQGHCNVPGNYSENIKLALWVVRQRTNYRLHVEGKTSSMTNLRIQTLEDIDFEWGCFSVTWEDRLSELADYREIQGHCNVPANCSESTKLARWVATQRSQYRFHLEGKKTSMTLPRIQELESLGFKWSGLVTGAWENRLSELVEYRKIQGHCNVPGNYSENIKLASWVVKQRSHYRLHVEGKKSLMTNFRIQTLEDIGFEWGCSSVPWEVRLSELADYRKIQGHCNVPTNCSENIKLAWWVAKQRTHYRLHLEGKKTSMTLPRIQELESLGFKWSVLVTGAWEDRLSELAEYRKIQGHCNVPANYSENIRLATWVSKQRSQYRLHVEGKKSSMTLPRIQGLESVGFQWSVRVRVTVAWEDRLSELADYRKIHGHCNVPLRYSENSKLARWVNAQRTSFKLHVKGKKSQMTTSRIQELESLGFEWKPAIGRRKGNPKKPSVEDDVTRVRERAVEVPKHVPTIAHATAPQEDFSGREIRSNQVDVAFELKESDSNGEVPFGFIPG